MAPRRSIRSVKIVNNIKYNNLSLNDVLCPICRSIFVEPVSLPCSHSFCHSCFDGTLANANLTCPLCRVRFGSWHRIAKKEQRIVNVPFWDAIKLSFPKQVKNRLNGVDENLEEETPIRLTKPGSLRKEYELQKEKEELKLAKQREADSKASEELIQKLKEEDELEEAVLEEKLRLDEQVAKQIAKEMGYIDKPTNSKILNTPKRRRPLDTFLKDKKHCMIVYKIQNKSRNSEIMCQGKQLPDFVIDRNKCIKNGCVSTNEKNQLGVKVSDKEDCISMELKHFKPIDQVNVPVTKVVSPIRIPAKVNKAATVIIGAPVGSKLFRHDAIISAFARFSLKTPVQDIPQQEDSITLIPLRKTQLQKRKLLNQNLETSPPKSKLPKNWLKPQEKVYPLAKRKSIHNTRQKKLTVHYKTEPTTEDATSKNTRVSKLLRDSLSPPFYGFDTKTIEGRNSSQNSTQSQSEKRAVAGRGKKLQEESDLEFAKKLHEELNKNRYCTRNSITQNNLVRKRRQVTLDEFVEPTKTSVK